MSDHDPLCPQNAPGDAIVPCLCPFVARVRADERERIAQAIEAMPNADPTDVVVWVWRAAAARIARATP